MDEDRLSIIRGWSTNPDGIYRIENEIENYSKNYDNIEDYEFFRIAFEFITQKKEFEGIDYRFLCWLNYKYGWEIKINSPFLVYPLSINIKSFKLKYLITEKRKELFDNLVTFISKIKLLAGADDTVSIIIGGSFTEDFVGNPNDIDCILLLNESYLDNFQLNENYLRECEQIPKGIDIHFLPKNFNLLIFKAYSHIMYFGNKAKFKDGASCINNEFEKRKIIKIEL